MNKRLGVMLVTLLTLLGATAAMAAYPISERGTAPILFNTGPGGNLTCEQAGEYEFESPRFSGGAQYGGIYGPISWSTTDNTFVSWTAAHGGLAVILKGGNGAHVYYYDGSYSWDGQLASPLNNGGNIADLSNITFCWNPPVVAESQWRSPGFWRQSHHLASWDATGYSPDDMFYGALGYYPPRTNQGVRQSATTNPTLWQVLQSPQWYGGEAFNAVGDLLSDAHPDVNFDGTRMKDSCPLN